MSDEAELPAAPTSSRAGSGADLARRMDRMEARQDTMESKVGELAAVVSRVELNQQHATELATLRFNAVDTAVKTIDSTLERFMGRINAIVTGEVKLPQADAYERRWNDLMEWQKVAETRIDGLDPTLSPRVRALEDRVQRQTGMASALSGTKGVILMICAIASPIVAAIGIIVTRP